MQDAGLAKAIAYFAKELTLEVPGGITVNGVGEGECTPDRHVMDLMAADAPTGQPLPNIQVDTSSFPSSLLILLSVRPPLLPAPNRRHRRPLHARAGRSLRNGHLDGRSHQRRADRRGEGHHREGRRADHHHGMIVGYLIVFRIRASSCDVSDSLCHL